MAITAIAFLITTAASIYVSFHWVRRSKRKDGWLEQLEAKRTPPMAPKS